MITAASYMFSAVEARNNEEEATIRQRIADTTAAARARQSRLAEERSRQFFRLDKDNSNKNEGSC